MVQFWQFSMMALPLWIIFYVLYFSLRKHKLFSESLWAKCGGTLLAVCSAGLGLIRQGRSPFGESIFWFFLLCVVADVLLELSFLPGMVVFGAGHVCFLVWLWGKASPGWWVAVLFAGALLASLILFRRQLPRLGWQVFPFMGYGAVLAAVLAFALPLPFVVGYSYAGLALGTAFFFISDMMVARQELADNITANLQKPIMVLYWLGLFLISTALWF